MDIESPKTKKQTIELNYEFYANNLGIPEKDRKAFLSALKKVSCSMIKAMSGLSTAFSTENRFKELIEAIRSLDNTEHEQLSYKRSQALKWGNCYDYKIKKQIKN